MYATLLTVKYVYNHCGFYLGEECNRTELFMPCHHWQSSVGGSCTCIRLLSDTVPGCMRLLHDELVPGCLYNELYIVICY